MAEGKLDHYFAAALLDIARRMATEVIAKNQVINFLSIGEHDYAIGSAGFIDQLIEEGGRYLAEQGLATVIEDDFGPTVYQLVAPIDHLELEDFENSIGKMYKFGSGWIEEAIGNIQAREKIDLTERLSASSLSEIEPLWTPLKIDRSPDELEADVGLLDAELSKIEGDNGYAASDPAERNAIVKPARGVLEAIKNGGMPSKEVIVDTLVKPFQYLSKKFVDASIGIAAKKKLQNGHSNWWLVDRFNLDSMPNLLLEGRSKNA